MCWLPRGLLALACLRATAPERSARWRARLLAEKIGDLPSSGSGFVHLPLNKIVSSICPSNDLDSNSTRF